MYLLVVVTLMVALIGIYVQVSALQTARLFSHQTALANTMLIWHSTALSLAQKAMDQATFNANGQAGCQLYSSAAITMNASTSVPSCVINAGSNGPSTWTAGNAIVAVKSATPPAWFPATMPVCSGSQSPPCWTWLPSDYNTSYSFYSIAYQLPGPLSQQNYVITFIPPPTVTNPPPGFICLPGMFTGGAACSTVTLGYTVADLARQMAHSGIPLIAYGTVVNGKVATKASSGGVLSTSTFEYPLPVSGGTQEVPDGSIALVSAAHDPYCQSNATYNENLGICQCNTGYTLQANGTCM